MKRLADKFLLLAYFGIGFILLSGCEDNLPTALDTASQQTLLNGIKIVNAGPEGNEIVEGMVDEMTKTVSFPRIDPNTDFSNLRFEADLSPGATLNSETYDVGFEEGESEKVIVVKVVNEPRYREYLVQIRLLVPVFGADFGKAVVYDYSSNPAGNPAYDAFAGLLTRGTGFDGEHVLVVSRGESGVHRLTVTDLINNETNRISLNMTGVSGGTYAYNMGAQVNGHTYVASLSGAAASPLKIYHWTDPTAEPEVVANINVGGLSGAGARHGDNISVNLNANGNGYIYFISLQGPVLRLTVAGYTTLSEPTVITAPASYGQWSSYLQVGSSDEYLVTGNTQPISVVNSSGTVSYTMGTSTVPVNASDARVIEFNSERYLLVITVARTGSEQSNIYLYDITQGATIPDALRELDESGASPVYEYNLSSTTTTAPGSQTGYMIQKDEAGNDQSLLLYGAAADAGFAVIEVPKKVLED